jgi:hypothetical protein
MTDNGSCYKSFAFARLPRTYDQTHPYQALHAQNQRQCRTLYPNGAARMRLRKSLSGLRSKSRGAANLDAPLQSASPARSLKSNPPISRLSRGGSARTIRLDLLDKSGVLSEGHKARVRGAWSVSTAAVQAAMSAASMISPVPAEGLGWALCRTRPTASR